MKGKIHEGTTARYFHIYHNNVKGSREKKRGHDIENAIQKEIDKLGFFFESAARKSGACYFWNKKRLLLHRAHESDCHVPCGIDYLIDGQSVKHCTQ